MTQTAYDSMADETGPQVFVHPDGRCESSTVGGGTRVWAFAHVLDGAFIGGECNIGDHAFVEGGARLGDRVTVKNHVMVWDCVTVEDDVFLGPGVVFTNDLTPRAFIHKERTELLDTLVRNGATIGANATIVCGTTIGRFAMVAAGAVVTHDVADHSLVRGNPARHARWVCICGRTLPDSFVCVCGQRFAQLGGGTPPSWETGDRP